jgi:hypothetical protein
MSVHEIHLLRRIASISVIAANVAFWAGAFGYAVSAAFDHFGLGAVL